MFGNDKKDYSRPATNGFGALPPCNKSENSIVADVIKKLHPNTNTEKCKQKKLPINFVWRSKKPGFLWNPDN